MKKTLSLLIITTILCGIAPNCFATQDAKKTTEIQQNYINHREQHKKEFEQRLNLSEKQKEKAREIHKLGREQMRPIMEQIEQKRQEIEAVKLSRMAERMQQERIAQISAEIKDLEKQAQDVRKKNSQEFEKILNKKQKTELDKMKAEGRARYEQFHRVRPPFQGLGTPGFLLKPVTPPPHHEGLWK